MLPRKATKKSKKNYKKKLTSYSRPVSSALINVPTPATNCPTRLKTTFVYTENGLGLNPGIAAVSSYVFDLNSLFDPNVSGVGHQPAGFDQMMSIYEEYCVYGVKYRIWGANSETSLEAIHGVTITDQATGLTADPRVYLENGQTQWQCVASRGGGNISSFSGYVDVPKVHGVELKTYMNSDGFKGTASASPADRAFLHIWAAPMNATSDIGDQVFYVELTYFAELSGGKLNALS